MQILSPGLLQLSGGLGQHWPLVNCHGHSGVPPHGAHAGLGPPLVFSLHSKQLPFGLVVVSPITSHALHGGYGPGISAALFLISAICWFLWEIKYAPTGTVTRRSRNTASALAAPDFFFFGFFSSFFKAGTITV